MRAYIKKLQAKDEDTRKFIFISTMIVCMSFVAFVWIYNLGTRFGNPKIAEQANEDIKPFKLFSNSLSDTYNNMSASVGKIKDNTIDKVIPEVKTEKQIDLVPVENSNQ